MSNNKTTRNPFEFQTVASNNTESRKLDYTPVLIDKSNQRASELMLNAGKRPELFDLANKAIDGGQPQDLIDLIMAVFDEEQIKADSTILEGCDVDQLSRLLESRRSDRSKAKKKNPRASVQVCKTYISAMYAELLIRKYWNKPYNGSNDTELDITDQDAISRKVKSLQSKKSRLGKIAQFDPSAQKELDTVNAEIARLNEFRPTVRVSAKTIVRDLSVDEIRETLKLIDPASLPEDEQEKLQALMVKLG